MSRARENRGLQIALVVFVSLNVLLGVTTFVFFRQYEAAARQATALAEKSQKSSDALRAKQDELSRRRQKLRRTEELLHDDSRQVHGHAEATRHQAAGQVAEAERRLESLRAEHREAQEQIEKLEDELRRLKQTEFTGPDGRIREVNYRLRTAWIDVGRADGLPPRLGFGVYPAAAWRLHDGNQKTKIEVTRVLDDHLSEAHVVEDVLTDPIIPGDQIQSAAWDRAGR